MARDDNPLMRRPPSGGGGMSFDREQMVRALNRRLANVGQDARWLIDKGGSMRLLGKPLTVIPPQITRAEYEAAA